MKQALVIKKRIRITITIFIVLLLLSGLTAFPIETELAILAEQSSNESVIGSWIQQVYHAVKSTNESYPYLAYGTDWLAFAHVILSILFIGPWIDPVKNKWVLQFGVISCVGVIPLALIAGPIREIPFFWQLIDCSFGVIGMIPLLLCLKWVKELEG